MDRIKVGIERAHIYTHKLTHIFCAMSLTTACATPPSEVILNGSSGGKIRRWHRRWFLVGKNPQYWLPTKTDVHFSFAKIFHLPQQRLQTVNFVCVRWRLNFIGIYVWFAHACNDYAFTNIKRRFAYPHAHNDRNTGRICIKRMHGRELWWWHAWSMTYNGKTVSTA